MKFFNVASVEECEKMIREHLKNEMSFCVMPTLSALGKTLSKDIISSDVLPSYDRSTVDGYAVNVQDVYCASAAVPAFLKVVGRVKMGEMPSVEVGKGESVAIATGAVLPKGATGVVMIENVEVLKDEIAVYSPIKNAENTVKRGEEIELGQVVAKRGEKVTSFLVGVLAGLGIEKVEVYDKIRVAVISTGDELVDVCEDAKDGKIRDVNTSLISAFAINSGFEIVYTARVKDDKESIENAVKIGTEKAQIVFMSGGSSIGQKDFTNDILDTLGEVLVHGVAQKPGKPTVLAKVNGKLVYGLPGNPFAAALVFKELCADIVKEIKSEKQEYITAVAGVNFPSSPGRKTMQPVAIEEKDGVKIATPIFLKSAHLATILKADGYVKIPTNAEGVNAGENVKVYPFY